MTWEVIWEPGALDTAAGHLKDAPEALDALIEAARLLETDSRPPGSLAWGTEHRRYRAGRLRVLYRIDPEKHIIHIEHIGLVVE
ncbi:type II toxin-antitoxin system RelE/ParE family toxin [Actinopolymorpha sp. NPDC004070]|uniref:type II toxin-antitoxin system RelE family toxin n=1 Tax=Actinopolymorpha sp. NPDC004070 TaxID=3154548 RepID=UPI0033A06564